MIMLLMIEAAGLLCLAVALAGPVSAGLARAAWTTRDPRAGLVLWQAVGLGGGLGILGAGLTLAASTLDDRWLPGIAKLPGHLAGLGVAGWAGVGLTLTVGVWLAVVTQVSMTRVSLARRAHRQRLDAVAEILDPEARATVPVGGVRLVDHPRAVAYCLPGLRPRVVVSRGALTALDDGELAAVLAHEHAHARGRHDLVIQPFIAWASTFPFLPTASRAVSAVELLVELLADDAARRTCRPEDLRRALSDLAPGHVAQSRHSESALAFQLAARASRLAAPPRPLPLAMRALVYVAAVALILLPPAVLLLS